MADGDKNQVVNYGGITVTLSVLRTHLTHMGTHVQGLMLLAIIAMHSTLVGLAWCVCVCGGAAATACL